MTVGSPVGPPESSDAAGAGGPAESVEPVDPVDPTELADPTELSDPTQPVEPAEPPVPLLRLAEPLPAVVETRRDLEQVVTRLRQGTGPVALDAERASGYRYSQRAYLVQLRRRGTGTALVDPVADDDPVTYLAPLATALSGPEWILHAASQDLVCLAEIGLRPRRLFDTELAARLLGLRRSGSPRWSRTCWGSG